MPISDARRCIFVHIPRTGGSSIDRVLGVVPADTTRADAVALFGIDPTTRRSLQHLTASEIRARVPAPKWTQYFRFAVVRNPFDRIVSEFFWRRLYQDRITRPPDAPMDAPTALEKAEFRRFVRHAISPWRTPLWEEIHLKPQFEFLYDAQGALLVDFVARFESLSEEFSGRIAPRVGISDPLPHEHAVSRPPYRTMYDADTRAIVAHHYSRDLEVFDYTF